VWSGITLAGIAAAASFTVFRSSHISSFKAEASQKTVSQLTTEDARTAVFGPTIPNTTSVRAPSPYGMAWIPGGEFSMGALDPPTTPNAGMHQAADARPIHRVYVDGFWMDKTDVTNEEFARFVKALPES
jgi:formylglycine-generating enzyme required for sulfatase activity